MHRDTRLDVAFLKTIKELRLQKGLSQKELAQKLSVPQSLVSKYESGERRIDIIELRTICEVLGTDLSRFGKLLENEIRKQSS